MPIEKGGESMVSKLLPRFGKYTVDERLRQFRYVPLNSLPEFIEFDSPKGKELLEAYRTYRSEAICRAEIASLVLTLDEVRIQLEKIQFLAGTQAESLDLLIQEYDLLK